MRVVRIILLLCLIFSVSSAETPSELNYSSKELFPLPPQLESAVRFWIQVYTKYHTNQYVLHDADNLNVIYEVVTLGEEDDDIFDYRKSSAERKFIEKRRKYYKNLLTKLASGSTRLDHLEGDLLRIYNLFGQEKNRSVYKRARSNIRVQKGQKNRFRRGLELSGRYQVYLEEIFRRHNLPLELTVLPHVESSFNYRAYSSAGAAGIWQFTRGTGRRFLKINYEIDERLDPILATEAAARLLEENYQELKSWPLAITAYNHGLAGMKRAKRKLKTDDIGVIVEKYKSRNFKFASKNFYCEFLAALHIVQNYRDYFGEVQFEPPLQFKEFSLPHYVKISTLADAFRLSVEELKKYNPALRPPIFADQKFVPRNYRLRLPTYIDPEPLYAAIPESELYVAQKRSKWYRVRRGDTLSQIARRNRTTIRALMAVNNLRNAHQIRVGEVLRLPDEQTLTAVGTTLAQHQAAEPIPSERTQPAGRGAEKEIREKRSTSPSSRSREASPKGERSVLSPTVNLNISSNGQANLLSEIELVKNGDVREGYIRVEPEETLGHYAEWLNVPTQLIRNWNDLAFGESIQIGQKIRLIFTTCSPEMFVENRLEYHRGIEEDFFNNYQVIGTTTHKVKRGENIWYLCNNVYNLPFWLIKSYNSDLNLMSLRPGDTIVIPEVVEIQKVVEDSSEE